MEKRDDIWILIFSVPLIICTALVSIAGVFFYQTTYAREVISYTAQAIGQDLVDLIVVVPTLIISSIWAYRRNKIGELLWNGTLFYLFYSFLIYSFGLHFNQYFLIYCVILGLSTYGLLYFLVNHIHDDFYHRCAENINVNFIAIYLIVIAVLFYFLWLSEIIPSIIKNSTPASIVESNIMINPVHVADIAVCLPLMITTGILLIKRKGPGYLLAPLSLFFTLLLALAVLAMIIFMGIMGSKVNLFLTIVFAVISLTSLGFLIIFLRKIRRDCQAA